MVLSSSWGNGHFGEKGASDDGLCQSPFNEAYVDSCFTEPSLRSGLLGHCMKR